MIRPLWWPLYSPLSRAITEIVRGIGAFDPFSYFAAGEKGLWLEAADKATLFQDSAGTTPVTAPGQPVGLWLDKSKGLVLGPELVVGILDSSANWTLDGAGSVSASSLVINSPVSTSTNQVYVPPVAGTFVAGKSYSVTFTVVRTQGQFTCGIGSSPAYNSGNIAESGTYTLTLPCGGATPNRINFASNSSAVNNFIGSITNISVKLLPGNHFTQSTAGKRPMYVRFPAGGTRNLLTYTGFDGATTGVPGTGGSGWAVTDIGGAGQNVEGDRIRIAGTAIRHYLGYSGAFAATAGGTYTLSVKVEVISASSVALSQFLALVLAGTPTTIGYALDGVPALSTDLITSGTHVISVTASTLSGGSGSTIRVGFGTSGAQTGDVWVSEPQLELGSTATPYQKVVSSADVTEAGVADVWAVKGDGVDDFMSSAAIDFTSTDKVSIWAGVRKLDDTARMVAELSANWTANNGAFALESSGSYSAGARGAAAFNANQVATIAQSGADTVALTMTHDIAGDLSTIRRNGVAGTNGTGDKGTGNLGNQVLYLFSRAGTSAFFNGPMSSLIVRGAATDAAGITSGERWTAQRIGATLP